MTAPLDKKNIYYAIADQVFLKDSIGFKDPNLDGILTEEELNSTQNSFGRFYSFLTPEQQSLFDSFGKKTPLSQKSFSIHPLLSDIAIRYIEYQGEYKIITAQGLPKEVDSKALSFDNTNTPHFLVNKILLNPKILLSELTPEERYKFLEQEHTIFPSPTIKLLRHFLRETSNNQHQSISYTDWYEAYSYLIGCTPDSTSTPETTWNELLLIWQDSESMFHEDLEHSLWHPTFSLINGIYKLVTDGEVKLAAPNQQITSIGIKKYLKNPDLYFVPNTIKRASQHNLKSFQVVAETTWNKSEKLDLFKTAGIDTKGITELNLDIEKGAKITAYSSAENSNLRFHVGKPILEFQGFHLNLDRGVNSNKVTKLANNQIPWLNPLYLETKKQLGLEHTEIDLETLNVKSLSVINNRLVLLFSGTPKTDYLVQPLEKDLLFIDITFFIKSYLEKNQHTTEISKLFFDKHGNVNQSVTLEELQNVLISFFQNKKIKSANLKSNSFLSQHNQDSSIKVDNIFAEYFPKQKLPLDESRSLTRISLSDGKIKADKNQKNWNIQGKSSIQIDTLNNNIPNRLIGDLEFYIDSNNESGFAKIKIPYSENELGEILIGIQWDQNSWFENGNFNLESFLKSLNLQILLEIKEKHKPILAAYFTIAALEQDSKNQELTKIVSHFKSAYNIPQKNIFGIVNGGEFFTLQNFTNNFLLTSYFNISSENIVNGGLAQLFGKDAQLIITKENSNEYRIYPQYNSLKTDSPIQSLSHLNSGYISILRQKSGFQLEFHNVTVYLEDASFSVKEHHFDVSSLAQLNGSWETSISNFSDLFSEQVILAGSGSIILDRTKNRYNSFDPNNNFELSYDSSLLHDEIKIHNIVLNPFSINTDVVHQIHESKASVKTPYFVANLDLRGEINVSGRMPLVSIEVAPEFSTEEIPELTQNTSTTQFANQTISEPLEISDYIDNLLKTVDDYSKTIEPLSFDFNKYLSDDYDHAATLNSIDDVSLNIDELPVMTGYNYEISHFGNDKRTQIPFITGAFSFLNPKVSHNTFIHTNGNQEFYKNNEFNNLHLDFNKPIKWLGIRITGIHVDNHKDKGIKLHLKTKSGSLNLMTLLTIAKPAKVIRSYKKAKQMGLNIKYPLLPLDLVELGSFLKILTHEFEVNDKIEESISKKSASITVADIDHLGRKKILEIFQKLESIKIDTSQIKFKNKKSLARLLNKMAKDKLLAESLQNYKDQFPNTAIFEAENLIDENLHILYGEEIYDHDLSIVSSNNYRLIRLFLSEYILSPNNIDIEQAKNLEINIYGTPQKGMDIGIVEFYNTNPTPISIQVAYNPQDSLNQSQNPGLYLKAGYKENEYIENAIFNLKTPRILVTGDFKKVEDVNYYLSPGTENKKANYSIEFENYDVNDLFLSYNPPSLFRRPTFALFSPSASGVNNHLSGSLFYLQRYDEIYDFNVNTDNAQISNSFMYFYMADHSTETPSYRDIMADLSNATATDIQTILEYNTKHYIPEHFNFQAKDKRINGHLNIPNKDDSPYAQAYIYVGTSEDGTRQYASVHQLSVDADFAVDNNKITLMGDIGLHAELPKDIDKIPEVQKLKEKGISIQIDSVEVRGTAKFVLDNNIGGIEQTEPLNPTLISVHGRFTFQVGESQITVTEVLIPIEKLTLKLKSWYDDKTPSSRLTINDFIISQEFPMQANLEGVLSLPEEVGDDDIILDNARLTAFPKSSIQFDYNQDHEPTLHTDGAAVQVYRNDETVLNLETGVIQFEGKDGQINEWALEVNTQDILTEALVQVLLAGDLIDVKLN